MIFCALPFLPFVAPAVWWFEIVRLWSSAGLIPPVHDIRDRYHVEGNVIRLHRGL